MTYEGPESTNPFAFRYYDPKKVILGKSMEEHLRFAVCYWHNFLWEGHDIFGFGTFNRAWNKGAASPDETVLHARRCGF